MIPRLIAAAAAVALLASPPSALAALAGEARWVGSWAASQQTPQPADTLPPETLHDATLRQVIHLSLGGARLRLRLSNAFGRSPLAVDAVHLAPSKGRGAIDPAADHLVRFAGESATVIPAGAEVWSDPVDMAVAPGADLAVSLHLPQTPDGETSHPGSRATSYLVPGDQTAAPMLPGAQTFPHWFLLSGADVEPAPGASAVVALGDSITDGHGATTDGNDRWTDDLARRLRAAGRPVGVLNAGLGGNRVLDDGIGPNALARLDRDVLAATGVRTVILLEGINDLGVLTRTAPVSPDAHARFVRRLLAGYAQVVTLCRAHGLRVLGGTITPDGGSDYYHPDALNEADRRAVNSWIRAPGHFDGVVDFDQAVRDPAHPDRLRVDYDSGDHLHPSPAGYRAMAAAVPLTSLR
jgi:lysophospholipase L1-like esterase